MCDVSIKPNTHTSCEVAYPLQFCGGYHIDGMLIIKKEREHSLLCILVCSGYCRGHDLLLFSFVLYVVLYTRLYGKRSFSQVAAAGYMHLAYTLGL